MAPTRQRLNSFDFDRIRGQSRAVDLLRDAVRSERVAQAYLLHGAWGVGKTTTALAMGAALNCEADPEKRPCGKCTPCRKVARFNHPDVRVVLPLYPAGLWKEEADKGTPDEPGESPLCRLLSEWADDPFYVFRWSKRPSIATEWVLELKREASRKTFEGRTKVIIFAGVESMGVEAANRILKMLEEPGPNTVFILTTSRLHQVLPTIRSRCQRVGFGEVARDEIESVLRTRFQATQADARLLAALARGSIARAVVLLDERILETREWTLKLLRSSESAVLAQLADEVLGRSRSWGARDVRHVAEILMAWYRDLLAVRHGLPETKLANQDQLDRLRKDAAGITAAEVRRRVHILEELTQAVEHQVTPPLALFAALAETAGGVQSGSISS